MTAWNAVGASGIQSCRRLHGLGARLLFGEFDLGLLKLVYTYLGQYCRETFYEGHLSGG